MDKKSRRKRPFNIDERTISESEVKRKLEDGTIKSYPQYRITLPKEFVDEHKPEKVYLIADSVGMFLPDEKSLMRVLVLLPRIREIIEGKSSALTQGEIEKIFESFPEIKKYIEKEQKEKDSE